MTDDGRYEAVRGRDARFDGEFFFAVATTGIYCRPSCPATTPRRKNVRFFPTAAAAQGGGFRACRRCRPDAVPGSAAWNTRADVVGRAMRMIGDGVVDREGVAGLARRLGYSPRQVQRQLNAELGAGPIALARAQRAHTARILLQTTGMQATEVAFAAGFSSVRQFNDTIKEIYASTPTGLRDARPGRSSRFGPVAPRSFYGGVPLRLAYRGPYAAAELFDQLALHTVPGVEEMVGERGARTYRRTLRLPHGHGVAEVDERLGAGGWLECRLCLGEPRDLTTATQRMRRLFDLDADPYAVAEHLGADPLLAPLVAARPGLRSPGAADPQELAVRAVLGRRLPPDEARARGAALVSAYGQPLTTPSGSLTHLFPDADTLAGDSLDRLELPGPRRTALRALTAALADGIVPLDAGADRDQAEKELLNLDGIGPRTAGYIRMRALGDPDVLLLASGISGISGISGASVAPEVAEGWRPWRSYATHHLWAAAG
ncbi:DNA-3-methyladenine glycosylase 2 family protein [Streptomyces sp. NA02950]|uniref:DNA-3-methyladenine glycosylase 2 family protein n=1 Tax=Streptomyces sp. NA02950 TaxID=2742137 RepID=UPI00158FA9D7|nr:DNA-3-methyladenine glycosylase 2 family protein [Streptomyces sp. NA02950]QKV97405.1 DNA-3-methyladenine glycosylase 2 family protein [Streptomyces sp. NA02950]